MDFSWSDEQGMLRETARRFFQKECPSSLVKEMMKDDTGHVPELWQKMAELGWMGLVFHERFGGSGGRFMDLLVLLEEMGRAMLPGPFFSSVVLAGLTLVEAGDEEIASRYLRALCSGEVIMTLALTEEDGRWDARSIRCLAEKDENSYVVTGRKMFVSDAHLADPILLLARSGPQEGALTLMAMHPRHSGLTLKALIGIAGDKQFEMVLDGVVVPEERRIGAEGEAWIAIQRVLPKVIIARCAQMVGGMERVVEMTVQYVKDRQQFGVPIGIFQAIQHYCVDMLTRLETARLLTHQAAWKADADLPCRKEASAAKAMCNESFNKIAAMAHQIHGGIGFTEEHDLHIYSKHAKGWQLLMGDAVHHRSIVAGEIGL